MKWAEAIAFRIRPQEGTSIRWDRQWDWQLVVGAVPVLPPEVTDPGCWTMLIRGGRKFAEAIYVKDSRAEVLSIRLAARSVACHGMVVVTLCVNLSGALAHEKRRARDYGLRVTIAVGSAYCIACNFRWHHRYVISQVNPDDWGSREAGRGVLAPGEKVIAG